MKSKYTAPVVLQYGTVDTLTQFVGKNPTDDSFSINGGPQIDADGSCAIIPGVTC